MHKYWRIYQLRPIQVPWSDEGLELDMRLLIFHHSFIHGTLGTFLQLIEEGKHEGNQDQKSMTPYYAVYYIYPASNKILLENSGKSS